MIEISFDGVAVHDRANRRHVALATFALCDIDFEYLS
jgi:hypothetical protein